jgi:hypothetical protein
MSLLQDLLDLLLGLAQTILDFALGFAKKHPVETGLAILALLRLFGTTVQTGYKGVLFVFGRVRKELEPGFHPLLPVILAVRKIPVRSVTLDLPKQRLTTADGLVYDLQANVVYRVVEPKRALTQIDHLRKGIETILPLVLEELVREQTRAAVLEFKALEADFIARAEKKLQRWGVTVEQAGFKTITPGKQTLRLTQLALLANERHRVVEDLIAEGVPLPAALALLGADRRLVGHATARYRALHRHAHLAPAPAVPPRPPRSLPREQLPTPEQPPETTVITVTVGPGVGIEVSTQASPQPRKTTKGMQPRSWLRLKRRLERHRARKEQTPVGPGQTKPEPGDQSAPASPSDPMTPGQDPFAPKS